MNQRTAFGKGGVPSLRNPIPLPQNLPITMVGFARAAENRGGAVTVCFMREIFVLCNTQKKKYLFLLVGRWLAAAVISDKQPRNTVSRMGVRPNRHRASLGVPQSLFPALITKPIAKHQVFAIGFYYFM